MSLSCTYVPPSNSNICSMKVFPGGILCGSTISQCLLHLDTWTWTVLEVVQLDDLQLHCSRSQSCFLAVSLAVPLLTAVTTQIRTACCCHRMRTLASYCNCSLSFM